MEPIAQRSGSFAASDFFLGIFDFVINIFDIRVIFLEDFVDLRIKTLFKL